jgi:hypothetical protein
MKYIITESRLDKVIFKYLDMKLDGIELKKGIYADIVFAFPNEEFGLMGWTNPDNLFTYYKVVKEIEDTFSMSESETLDVIGRYVESRFNLKVSSNDSLLLYIIDELKVKVD